MLSQARSAGRTWGYTALCTIVLAAETTAFLLPAPHGAGLRRSVLSTRLSNRPASVTVLRASESAQGESKSKAEVLAEELKTDLAQMFDLSYEPKWDLYSTGNETWILTTALPPPRAASRTSAEDNV
jgi:hypothetical protein